MEEDTTINLDLEYKRYLQILRPYLEQLPSSDIIDICKAWIHRLSNCKENEKYIRNKYVFQLCYKLAKGILDEPFTKFPSDDDLEPLHDDSDSDESFSEIECLVIDPDNECMKTLYNNQKTPLSVTENASNASYSNNNMKEISEMSYNSGSLANSRNKQSIKIKRNLIFPVDTKAISKTHVNDNILTGQLEYRACNVIEKLRQMKQENMMLHREILLLKEESKLNNDFDDLQDHIIKVDNSTSACMQYRESNTTLNSLKCKLQEVQDSRNKLIETLSNLQETLDHYEELKKHELNEIIAEHKLQVIKLKTAVREDTMTVCEKNIANLKLHYEDIIKVMNQNHKIELEKLETKINEITEEKNTITENKELEILQLNSRIENMKSQFSTLPNCCDKNMQTERVNELEKRLYKLEKTKNKNAKTYEFKIANIQREKHLTECSLQLQLIKQRAQVVSEMTDENQTELITALEKLEGRYKEIIGNVQATAVQRRIQDQITLESLIKTICDIPLEGNKDYKVLRHQGNPVSNLETAGNKGRHLIVGDTLLGDEYLVDSYHLNNEKLEELFGRIHIPQKDINNDVLKKP